jgi:hypothetical protein
MAGIKELLQFLNGERPSGWFGLTKNGTQVNTFGQVVILHESHSPAFLQYST